MKALLRVVMAYVVISGVLTGLALLQSFPARPTTWTGWLLLFALALPVTLLAELLSDALFRNPLSRAVERRTQGKTFSWLRVAMGMFVLSAAFAAVMGVSWLAGGLDH